MCGTLDAMYEVWGWQYFVGSLKIQVTFAKEPYKYRAEICAIHMDSTHLTRACVYVRV